MEKNGYNNHRKNRSISIQLYMEEGHILSDTIYFQYNMTTDHIGVYEAIIFRTKTSPFVTICKGFLKPRLSRRSGEITRYARRHKYISVKILKEEGYILSDIILVQHSQQNH